MSRALRKDGTERARKGSIADVPGMIAMYRAGHSTRAIAEHFGVRPPAITRKLNENGIKPDKGRAHDTAARQRFAARGAARRDELAELVANGASITDAAARMGISPQRASQHWQRIKADLGWQAV